MSDKSQRPSLLPEELPFSTAQKHWLSGYLAGLQATCSALQGASAQDGNSALRPLLIAFGSQTGNAAALAEDCAEKAGHFGLSGEVRDMDSLEVAQLAAAERLLLITSTYGEGEMPDNAQSLWEKIAADDAPHLENTFFSVLALGDSSYEHFCLAGKQWDARLKALGAKQVAARVDCDIDYDEKTEAWMAQVLPLIAAKGNQESANKAVTKTDRPAKKSGFNRRNPLMARLKSKRLLSASGSDKQILHYEIDLSGSGEHYKAGDVLNIIPQNRMDLVAEVLEAVNATAEERVVWQGQEIQLGALLRDKLEIRMPSRDFFTALMQRNKNEEFARQFQARSHGKDDPFFYGRDIVDFLRAYRDPLFSAQDLIKVLKPLAPRAYSISSSMKKHADEVHLTVASVRYVRDDRAHHGVASTWLADAMEAGDTVPCYFVANKYFAVPSDTDAPIIMVGPGTGIAPFRAFLEEREAIGATGDNWLFFGDRTRANDFIYQEELSAWCASGLLNCLDLAFSRDQAEKIYVQDKMRAAGAQLFAWLQRGAYFFVCGDAERMAKDVDKALHQVIAEHGRLSDEQARSYVVQLKKAKRYVRDVY